MKSITILSTLIATIFAALLLSASVGASSASALTMKVYCINATSCDKTALMHAFNVPSAGVDVRMGKVGANSVAAYRMNTPNSYYADIPLNERIWVGKKYRFTVSYYHTKKGKWVIKTKRLKVGLLSA